MKAIKEVMLKHNKRTHAGEISLQKEEVRKLLRKGNI